MKTQIRLVFNTFLALVVLLPSSIGQFVNFEETWKEFLANEKTSNISNLTKPPKGDVNDYAKYCLMYTNTYFCSGNIDAAHKQMEEIRRIGEEKYGKIPGFINKYDELDIKIEAYHIVDNLWNEFLRTRQVDFTALEDVYYAQQVCEKGTLAKFAFMMAYGNYCKGDMAEAKKYFQKRVITLAEKTSLKISDVEGLEQEVTTMKQVFAALDALEPAWNEYLKTNESPGFDTELPEIACYPIPSMKAYILQASVDVCDNGAEMIDKIKTLQVNNNHTLDKSLREKIEWLDGEVQRYNGDLAVLNKAWKDFIPDNELDKPLAFDVEYCEKDAQTKAYIIEGTIYACDKGWEMLEKIAETWQKHQPDLDDITLAKIKGLKVKMENIESNDANLRTLWNTFVTSDDTLTTDYQLAETYCDPVLQITSWTIAGHMNPCADGQDFLNRIERLQDERSLAIGDTLTCRIQRLRQKVWDCRYWELVEEARKQTHAEREKFGPSAALIMQTDLNSDQLPCETTVQYTPLGYIGVKYVISTYLCQEIDLAKMGDPEYYKKIATWVDKEVLQAYCEESMRCKEDFFIYLEGHTDGHPFKGARYKNSLDIPEGTPFTHFTQNGAEDKTTERELTTTLRSNMELGIARAWTVKQQLDFMGVPIKIGAYEHPSSEKGGEYRKVDIELNITNLLLDFYEKRLQQLIAAAQLGERPEGC